MLEFVNTLLAS